MNFPDGLPIDDEDYEELMNWSWPVELAWLGIAAALRVECSHYTAAIATLVPITCTT
jgi:hypothetical protein